MNASLRSRLRQGELALGTWLQFGHTAIVEAMAQAGFDWIGIDLEHSAIDIHTAFSLIQVADLAGCAPIVRLSSNDPVQAKRVMDSGAHGIIVPNVNSAAESRQAAGSVRYPPEGRRGVGLSRAQAYGARFAEYVEKLNDQVLVFPMIESVPAVEAVEEIVRVPGIDGVFVGPYDLSASLGVTGQLTHPLLRQALDRVVRAARTASLAAGMHVVHPSPDGVSDAVASGYRFIAYGGDMLFLVPALREAARLGRQAPTRPPGA